MKLFGKRKEPYKELIVLISEFPIAGVGEWAVKTMKALEKYGQKKSAIHLARLLTSDGDVNVGMDRALGYMTHLLDQEGSKYVNSKE